MCALHSKRRFPDISLEIGRPALLERLAKTHRSAMHILS
jgi:hypothetical protein